MGRRRIFLQLGALPPRHVEAAETALNALAAPGPQIPQVGCPAWQVGCPGVHWELEP